jgi:hypothetical protein
MRPSLIFVLGLLALLTQRQPLTAQLVTTQLVPFPQNDAVKLRLEIEIRGVLSVTEKAVTVTHKETIHEWVEVDGAVYPDPNGGPGVFGGPVKQIRSRQVDKVWSLELDDNLRKMAKTLHGKDIVVTGKCLVLGVDSRADTGKIGASIGTRTVQQPRGLPPVQMPAVVPEGIATSVTSQLRLDATVTVISLKAAK